MPGFVHLVWHRAELRVHDQPALIAAIEAARQSGGLLTPVVVIDDHIFARQDLTPRRQAWFLANVAALRARYRELGSDLLVRQGKPSSALPALARELAGLGYEAKTVHFVRNFTPYAQQRDEETGNALRSMGIVVESSPGHYVHEPGEILTASGGRYGVYSAFRRNWDTQPVPWPLAAPTELPAIPPGVTRGEIPTVSSDIVLPAAGEGAAQDRLELFLDQEERNYAEARNLPALEAATSRLSYSLNIGTISSRLCAALSRDSRWRGEVVWRDFFTDVLHRCPESLDHEYDARWATFPWRYDEGDFDAWRDGCTGYPIVDAGMRELAATGFMHNRVRMIVASFLTKHLLIDWRWGEAHFHAMLLDGDRAQNVGNWQWCAGCGVDAAPYFRVFNPVTQGKKFDPAGEYVRRWVPELRDVPAKFIHTPWEAGLLRGQYPPPIIELAFGRERFLATAKQLFGSGAGMPQM